MTRRTYAFLVAVSTVVGLTSVGTPAQAAQLVVPDGDVSNAGSWFEGVSTADGDTALWNEITDEAGPDDASTFDRTADMTQGDANKAFVVSLASVADPNSSANHTILVRARKNQSGGINLNLVVTLQRPDGSAIASFTTPALDAAWTDYTYTLTAAQADSIASSDYSDLSVKIDADPSAGGTTNGRHPEVTKVELQLPDEGTVALPQCADNLDNDLDGNVDYPADVDCDGANDTTESSGWTDPACEEDGSDLLDTAYCTPTQDLPQPPPDLDICDGATYCELTYEALELLGFSSVDMDDEDAEALAQIEADMAAETIQPLSTGSESTGSTSGTYYGAWVSWYNYNNKKCQGTKRDNNHCAWLYHKYKVYVGGAPKSPIYVSTFPSRSGNNKPDDKWWVNHGPIPGEFKACPNCSNRRDYRWGRMNGRFTGYERDNSIPFYPGKWRLDPWTIYKPSNTNVKRGAFEIHGGRNTDGTSRLWTTRTQGCIRLSIPGVRGLKGKWDWKTDNRRTARVYVRHNA